MHAKLVATFGLDEEENAFIEKHLPQKECGIMDTDVVTDIIAIDEFAVIVRADAMSQSDMEMLYDFYGEVAPLSETVIFIGDVTVPANLKNHIAVYKDFDTLKENLKYIETLRVAGEWIEYDTTHKGWYLQVGKSVLWGDFDED